MAPEPRKYKAGDREIIVRLNMANMLAATRRFRPLLAEHGIVNVFGPGSDAFNAALMGQGTLSALEADAVLSCAALVENQPAIGVEDYIALRDEFPDLAGVIEDEIADFFRTRPQMMGPLKEWKNALMQAVAQVLEIPLGRIEDLLTGGPGSELSPSLTSESPRMPSGEAPSETSTTSNSAM